LRNGPRDTKGQTGYKSSHEVQPVQEKKVRIGNPAEFKTSLNDCGARAHAVSNRERRAKNKKKSPLQNWATPAVEQEPRGRLEDNQGCKDRRGRSTGLRNVVGQKNLLLQGAKLIRGGAGGLINSYRRAGANDYMNGE